MPVREVKAAPPPAVVECCSCGAEYDGATVPFCECLTSSRTPRCPHCGACLCRLPLERQRAFWASAPPVLWHRKVQDRNETSRPAGGTASVLARPLVLVAEDDPATLRIAQLLLERMGYGVLLASDGREALNLASDLKPDLVLTDALMPKLDGRQLCLQLKQHPQTQHIKVVIMTGLYTQARSAAEAITHYRADAFLKKPVDFAELQSVLESLLPKEHWA